MSERIWHVAVGDESQGPFTLEEIVARVGRDIGPDTQVWNPQMSAWSAARSVPELAARLAPPAAAPAPAVPPPSAPRPPVSRPAAGSAAVASGAPRARSTAGLATTEESTLNPFKLIMRSFRWRGRFDRGEFAMIWFGVALLNGLFLGLVFLATVMLGQAVAGREGAAVGMFVFWGILILDVIGAVLVNFGTIIRRLNDLGKPAWWLLGSLVPLLNLALVLYLLFAPGDPNAEVPESFQAAVIAIAAVCGVGVLGGGAVIAAIAIPSLLRARISANEASAIGDVRTVISAQVAYSMVNGGAYDSRFECLVQPAGCVPGYSGPQFLDATFAESPRRGYQIQLHAGEPMAGAGSASSVTSFAIVAWPVEAGKTGVRLFCGDSTGVVCSATGVEPVLLVDASSGEMHCSDSCQPLY